MSNYRSFIKVCQDMPDHPKFMDLSDRAFRDIVSLWCWCAKYQTDGQVQAAKWAKQTTPESAKELITKGLVEPEGDGFRIHDYLDHQQSKAQIESTREIRALAGARGGRKAAAVRRQASATASATATPVAKPNQKREREVEEEVEEEVNTKEIGAADAASPNGSRRRPAHALPADWQPSTTHDKYAAAHGLDLSAEVFKFRNHAIANDRRQASWDATFANWLANSLKFSPPAKTRDPRIPEGW